MLIMRGIFNYFLEYGVIMINNYEKSEIEKIKQKLKISLNHKQNNQMNETVSENQSNFSPKESLDVLKEIKIKNNLLDTLDTDISFGEKHLSLTSYLFNKQISQKYLNALKYFVLHESLEKQDEINTLLIDLVIRLTKQLENISKKNNDDKKDILDRLEKIEEKFSKV